MLVGSNKIVSGANSFQESSTVFGIDRATRNSRLYALYRYWKAVHDRLGATPEAQIDPIDVAAFGLVGNVHQIDLRPSDPTEFRFDLYGIGVPMGGDFTGERVVSVPTGAISRSIAEEYREIGAAGIAHFSRCERVYNGSRLTYERLCLPLGEPDRPASGLFVACAWND